VIAPIDVECPACKEAPGSYCTSATADPGKRLRVTFHHAERVDAAMRTTKAAEPDLYPGGNAPDFQTLAVEAVAASKTKTITVYYGLLRVRVERGRLVPLWYTIGDAASFDQMTVVDGEHTIAICTLPARSKEEARKCLKEELRWFAPLIGDAVPEPWFASEDP